MDTADDLALQQDQEEAQHSKYAPLRPSVPWAVSVLPGARVLSGQPGSAAAAGSGIHGAG